MDFLTAAFLLFLPGAILALRAARSGRQAESLLVVLSVAFYAYHRPGHVLLFVAVVASGWLAAAYSAARPASRQAGYAWKAAGLMLLPLLYFKYSSWIAGMTGRAGLQAPDLPLGISFYTFQAIAFCVSVGRAEHALGSAGSYAAVMTAFPQVVAGPIVRMGSVRRSLNRHVWWRRSGWREGLFLFLSGAAKKAVLADGIGRIVDPIFSGSNAFSSGALWTGVLAYALQIYWDFSGYSDMALGLGRMIGWKLPSNFEYPYQAESLRDFWRRWHQTLSAWLRDYVYIPLGGSRHGELRTMVALLLTMLLGGLWHGASWCFVLWGAGHGLALLLERLVRAWASHGRAPAAGVCQVLGRLWTLLVVVLLWVPFRLGSEGGEGVARTLAFWGRMFSAEPGRVDAAASGKVLFAWLMVLLLGRPRVLAAVEARLRGMSVAVAGALVGLLALAVILAAEGHGRQFIYFVF